MSNVMGMTPKQEAKFRSASAPLSRNYLCAKCGNVYFDFTGRRRVMIGKYSRWICASCAAKRKARCVEQRAGA